MSKWLSASNSFITVFLYFWRLLFVVLLNEYMLSLKAELHLDPLDSTLRVVWMMASLPVFTP